MSTGIISIGVTGLQAAQMGLMTSEHNITNANTPGYNRQRILQGTNNPIMTGAGAVGQGTHVSTIERMYSQFLSGQVNSSQTNVSELDSYYSQVSQIDNMLADPNSGLSPALQAFFKGVQQVAANPSLMPSRQSMVSSAQSLASRFQGIESRLSELADGVNSQITSTVSTINSYAQQIANLNERIIVAQSSTNQPANDLLDQRDQVINDLNKLIKVSTNTNTDGSYNVFIGTGQQLVVGTQVTTMTANASSADPSRIVVGLQNAGTSQELPEYLVTGGQLGGLVRFRSESLDPAINEMGRVAASMALTFNAQQALGQDLLGQSNGTGTNFQTDFFDIQNMEPKVISNANNKGTSVVQANFALASAYTLSYDGTNYTVTRQSNQQSWTGGSLAALQATLSGAGVAVDVKNADVPVPLTAGNSMPVYSPGAAGANTFTNLTLSDYRLSYDGANYTMTRLSDNKQWNTPTDAANLQGLSAVVSTTEGFTFNISAPPVKGDTFLIQPTHNAAGNIDVNANIAADPRLVAAGLPMRTSAAITNTGTGAISNGQTVLGYSSASIPAGGVTIQYDGTTKSLKVNAPGLPGAPALSAQADLWVTLPNGTTTSYAGPTPTIPYVAGSTLSFAGMTFQISGQPNDQDTFTITSNTGNTGIADGRNANLFGQLQTQNTVAGGTANYQAAYAQFVSDTGNKAQETQVTSQAQQALLDQAQSAQQSLSGVNLDEEAANLLRYQQAYQAAAKIIDIGGKLFDTVLSIGS